VAEAADKEAQRINLEKQAAAKAAEEEANKLMKQA